ncbi:MAG: CNNM domain-containing protein, partial [Candidatus Hydrogenedentes bacterium]|nr:CNNM domain-containing protein [Candidatus Hydrogenedentota bacterium]
MEAALFEIGIIFILILANGAFAMSEIAVVSSRKSLLQKWADDGDKRASAALDLANSPSRFLATVQVGITLIGVCAGAFGGATLSEEIAVALNQVPALAPYSEGIALGIVVLAISYCSLILGELVPKRLALTKPETIASVMARPMNLLSRVTSPVVRVISASTDGVIRLLGNPASADHQITPEEISLLLEQGARSGIIETLERDMVESVLQLDERRIS